MKSALKMLAPYVAVLVFWCGLHNAWAALIAYHAQILFWSWRETRRVLSGWNWGLFLAIGLPAAAAGPLTYFLLPTMAAVPVKSWLASYGLSGTALAAMIPYYGLVHPVLEQAHWSGLRRHSRVGPMAHVLFAGYHAVTLASLMRPPWILACLGTLWVSSTAWRRAEERQNGGLLVPALSQILADSGLLVAALIRAGG